MSMVIPKVKHSYIHRRYLPLFFCRLSSFDFESVYVAILRTQSVQQKSWSQSSVRWLLCIITTTTKHSSSSHHLSHPLSSWFWTRSHQPHHNLFKKNSKKRFSLHNLYDPFPIFTVYNPLHRLANLHLKEKKQFTNTPTTLLLKEREKYESS